MGFWTQPLGKTLAERRNGHAYTPHMLNQGGHGFVNLAYDGTVKTRQVNTDTKTTEQHKFHVTDLKNIELVPHQPTPDDDPKAPAGHLQLTLKNGDRINFTIRRNAWSKAEAATEAITQAVRDTPPT